MGKIHPKGASPGAALLLLLGISGCAGFPWTGPGETRTWFSSLAPRQGAWAAASVLGLEVPSASREVPAPVLREPPRTYFMEARARPGRLYRFRKGGRFRPLCWVPPFLGEENLSLEELCRETRPQPLPVPAWEPRPKGAFPSFYQAYLEFRVSPRPGGGCRIDFSWKDRPGERLGERVAEHLDRALSLLEPLSRGNRELRLDNPVGALADYDRALAAGRPPCCAFHAECLARIHFNRALCLVRLGNLEEALLEAERARALGPRLPGALPLARTLASLLGGKRGAREGGRLLAGGRRLLASGRLREAGRVFLVARCRPDLRIAALQGLARAEDRAGGGWLARAHLLLALEESPGNPSILADLARLAAGKGRGVQALYWALPLGKDSPVFKEVLGGLPPAERAPFLALLGEVPPSLPDSPLKRALAAVEGRSPDFLSRVGRPSRAQAPPALPPR